MKKSIIAYLIILLSIGFGCQPSYKIYLVRHAEKGTEPANNPHLTEAGIKRSETLKDILKYKSIGNIYSTNTNRTLQTATPLSKLLHVDVKFYGMDTLDRFLQQMVSLKSNTLIIGHSNTLLPMLDKMNLQHTLKSIGDFDYSNLFIITLKNGKALKVEEISYGSR